MTLNGNTSMRCSIFDHNCLSRINGQLFCSNIWVCVSNPFLCVSFCFCFNKRSAEVVFLIMRIYVLIPVKQVKYCIYAIVVCRTLLIEHFWRIYFSGNNVFIYRVYIRVPLRFICKNGSWSMNNACRCIPSCSQLNSVSSGKVCDSGVIICEMTDSFFDFFRINVWIKSKVCISSFTKVVV